jgi:hypothetical protein
MCLRASTLADPALWNTCRKKIPTCQRYEGTREERSPSGNQLGQPAESVSPENISASVAKGIAWTVAADPGARIGSGPTSAPGAAPNAALQNNRPATPAEPSVDGPQVKPEPLPPWEILTTGAAARNSTHRAEAVAALGTIRPNRRVVNLIERALTDKDPFIRQPAARTLGEMRARASIPKLVHALADDSPEVSFTAAKRFGRCVTAAGVTFSSRSCPAKGSSSPGLIKGELEATKKTFQDPGKLPIIGAKEAASSFFWTRRVGNQGHGRGHVGWLRIRPGDVCYPAWARCDP